MQKKIIALLICFILGLPILCNASPAEGLYWCSLKDGAGESVDVLDVPSFDRGDVVNNLIQGERFFEHTYVTNYKGELWCKVILDYRKNYEEGYVPASVVERQQCPNGDERIPVRWAYGNGAVNFDGTKLRSAPNSDSNMLETMNTGAQCDVLARVLVGDNTWYRVNRNGTTGFISGTFLDVKPEDWGSLPVERL